MTLPPLPSWDALHPLIVHFPIALLLTAPVFVVFGLLRPRSGRGPFLAALVLMLIGTSATWLAVATGEAAGELASRSVAVQATLEHHEELAESTRTVFTILTLTFACLLGLPVLLRRRPGSMATTISGVVFLAAYLGGAVVLANTAHQGGQLVHVHGVHALVAQDQTVPQTAAGSGLLDVLDGSKAVDDD